MSWTLVLLALLLLWVLAFLVALGRALLLVGPWRARQPRTSSMDWKRRGRCLPIPDDVYRRPDPCIYAQYYLMSQGFAVTWDNPDIWLELNGVPVPSSQLQPDVEYDIVARIWNASNEAPAVNLPVHFYFRDFGIGGPLQAIATTTVDLPVKGAAGHPAFAKVKWRTPATPGHYCLFVALVWADDANPLNNVGQENTDVVPLNSPQAAFTFRLHNEGGMRRRFVLEADFYEVPAPPPCPDVPARQPALMPEEIETHRRNALAGHGRARHAVPAGWAVAIQPGTVELEPGDSVDVAVDVTAPDGFAGRQAINISALTGADRTGGVTVFVE